MLSAKLNLPLINQNRQPHLNGHYLQATVSADPAISLQNIQVGYQAEKPFVLQIDSLKIHQGERVALIGPSGAGKTTLLRLLNGYIAPQKVSPHRERPQKERPQGRVNILGQTVGVTHRQPWRRDLRRRVGFVFQNFNLIERASVFENVLWGRLGHVHPLLSLVGRFSEEDKAAAMAAIAEVDLIPQAGQRVDTLSGGQQQRVGVARVLAQEAEIILADEPVSNLDPALADDILALLVEVSQRHQATLLMTLHQPELAQRYADRIIGLRDGRIIYDQSTQTHQHFDQTSIKAIYGRAINRPQGLEVAQ